MARLLLRVLRVGNEWGRAMPFPPRRKQQGATEEAVQGSGCRASHRTSVYSGVVEREVRPQEGVVADVVEVVEWWREVFCGERG